MARKRSFSLRVIAVVSGLGKITGLASGAAIVLACSGKRVWRRGSSGYRLSFREETYESGSRQRCLPAWPTPLLVFFDKLIAAGMSHIFLKTLQKAYNAREGIQLL